MSTYGRVAAWLLAMSLLMIALAWPNGKAQLVAIAALMLGLALVFTAWWKRD